MKKSTKIILISLCSILIILGGIFIYNNKNIKKSPAYKMDVKSNICADELMSKEKMKEDLDYLVKTLKDVHPKAFDVLPEEQENIIYNCYEKIKNPLKAGEFYFVANEIACSFKDAHTSLYFIPNNKDKIIELPTIWLNNGMYIIENLGEFKKGDEVVSIGGKTPEKLLKEFTKIISAENQQWVRFTANLYLITEPYLDYLGLIQQEHVDIKLLRNEKLIDIKLPLINVKHSSMEIFNYKPSQRDWVIYTIDRGNSLGIFTLDQCINDNHYKKVLNNFFKDIQKDKINNIVVDLRKNTGGNSTVVDEFLRYLDIDNYKTYGQEVRFSNQVKQKVGETFHNKYEIYSGKEQKNMKINDDELVFKGKIYILTSPITFSSANYFAVMFKDNKIGTIVGEPTGNKPSSCGAILEFEMPNSKFNFSVSYKKFIRPDETKDEENCLNPDIIVYTTIDDILKNRDPQMEKVKEIIKK